MPKPFRFGVSAFKAASQRDWMDKARRAEDLGYSVMLVPDHLGEQVAPVPAISVAAAATTTLRVGTFVLDNDFRHPAVLAKEMATIDLLSDGRLEVGIGAGWKGEDYDASGIPFDRPKERVDRLEESVAVLKGLWGKGRFSFSGRHYSITDLDGLPKPLQQPHPPIFIGGGGRRMLGLAAGEANIVGLLPKSNPDGSGFDERELAPAALEKKVEIVRGAAGGRFADLELNLLMQFVHVTDDVEGATQRVARDWEISPEKIARMPQGLIGSRAQVAEKLHELRERFGISYFTVFGNVLEDFGPTAGELAGK